MIRADSANQESKVAITTAVAAAATPGATVEPTQEIAAPNDTAAGAGAAPASSAGASVAPNDTAAGAGAAPAVTAGGSTTVVNTDPKLATTRPVAEGKTTETKDLNAPTVNVGVDGMVEQFNAQDLEISTALHFLSLQSKRNIITSKEVTAAKATVTANLYNVTFAEALDALLKPNGFDYVERGNFIYVYTTKELEEIRKRDHKTANRIFRLHYLTAQDAAVLIKPLLSSNGVVALTPNAVSGLPTGVAEVGGMNYATDDTLVINDYPENLNEIARGLKQLDIRPKQVLVEATILNASLTDNNALGVDIVSLSGLDFPNLISAIGAVGGGTGGNSQTVTTGDVVGKTIANGNSQTNIGTDFASSVPKGGLSIGFLNNHVSAFVRALETVTNTSVVANPKVLTLNKHRGEVLIGQKLGYLTTSTSQTTTDQTVQFIDVGTKLVFRPFIGDNGYIRMEIHPEDSSGSIDSKGIPQKRTTEVTSNIMVKDGRTVVIGGLFREAVTAGRGQVPVLGNIPILGIPFRQTNDETQRSETIALITPHIINDDTALYDQSEREAADIQRQMLGNRAGLQPWSRDRIAQLWYSKAQEQLDKGCKEKAIMYNDWALNTQPQFIEAIKLREKLTSTKMEEATQSSIGGFVRDVLIQDGAITPDTGGAAHYPAPEPVVVPAPAATTTTTTTVITTQPAVVVPQQ